MCIVVDMKITSAEARGKADAVERSGRQQSETGKGDASRTPPGSESGAWIHRGNSGTWESHLSPCQNMPEEQGYRLTKSPGAGR